MIKRILLLATAAVAGVCASAAEAVPVALHYEAWGTTGWWDPNGRVSFSFDIYYDPTLLGSVSANGGLVTNAYYTYKPTSYGVSSIWGYAPIDEAAPFTSVTASVSPNISYQGRPEYRELNVYATGNGISGGTTIFIKQDGTFAYANYSFGVNVTANGRQHFTEDLFVRVSAVPEPATWAMMMAGIGVVGSALRRRRKTVRVNFA